MQASKENSQPPPRFRTESGFQAMLEAGLGAGVSVRRRKQASAVEGRGAAVPGHPGGHCHK